MTRRRLAIKPSCIHEIATFPADRAALLWGKVDALVSDPLPDGKVKKKLKGADGVYCIRVTDHRVFYRLGEDWISLLGIRRRAESTYDGDALRRLAKLRAKHVPGGSVFESRLRALSLDRLTDAWLLEEFEWIIEGRGLTSLAEYQSAARPGRGLPLNERARAAVWELYEAFAANAGERYPALRREALKLLAEDPRPVRYDYVVVDEAQDLSPVSLALMAEVCKSAEGLFFAADNKQSLYSRNYTWNSAHPRLQFRGRRRCFRATTAQPARSIAQRFQCSWSRRRTS
ncbi:UvrD-helicase domain-containing protein [Corallococcus interemptor]|uniref:UvrD-helicase domain-containing protein n=1 Tax=Corallococcus interemptor TaxID=2316720 RepID=UPI003CFF5F5F